MPISLPDHLASVLNLTTSEEAENIQTAFLALERPIGPLQSTGAQNCFLEEIGKLPFAISSELGTPMMPVSRWRLRTIEYDGAECAKVVEIPSQLINEDGQNILPPTDCEALLVRAWISSELFLKSDGQFRENSVVVEWSPDVTDPVKHVVRSICGIQQLQFQGNATRAWTEAGTIQLRRENRILSHRDGHLLRRLFNEASTESVLRWRFLSLYRVLEHGYLDILFEEFERNFFQEPTETVERATKALKSELEQFIRLVEVKGLKDHFEEMERINGRLLGLNNQFAILIDREAKKKNYGEPHKRGAALCYQIRCSIVHAGSYSVIFDKTSGADDAVLSYLSELENAVAKFLGVQFA